MADMEIVLVSFCSCLLSLCMLDFGGKKMQTSCSNVNVSCSLRKETLD